MSKTRGKFIAWMLVYIFLALLFGVIFVVSATAQPDPIQNLEVEWIKPQPKLQVWFSTENDTAWVANPGPNEGEYWGVRYQDRVGYARCPSVPFFNFGTLLHTNVTNFQNKLDCIQDVRTNIDTLTSDLQYNPPESFAVNDCKTKQFNAVDNLTVHIPTQTLDNVKTGSEDVVFAYDKNKTCVGYEGRFNNHPNVFPVASSWKLDNHPWPESGYKEGEPIKFALYDDSTSSIRALGYNVQCPESIPSDICSDGSYKNDDYLKVDTMFISSSI